MSPVPSRCSRRDVLRLALLGAVAPSLFACGGGHGAPLTYDATIADARDAIRATLAATGTSAISVALCDGERVLWAEAFGYVDRPGGTPPGPQTMFAIGSVSKMLAACATMLLVDRGQVALDAPLVRHVPDFRMASPGYEAITVRMLLSHTSGLPGCDYRNIFTLEPFDGYARQVQQTIAGQRLKHRPGAYAVYCNDGFTMLERLVESVTGRPYAEFVANDVLAPLRMTHSRYPTAVFPAGSYAPVFADGEAQPQECTNGFATGGLYSTPSDMARLAMMFINGGTVDGVRLLSPAAVAEMGRDQTAALDFNLVTWKWGLGWDGVAHPSFADLGITAWKKNGGTAFYGSDLYVLPGERLAVMISGTRTDYGSGRLAERILLNALAERHSIDAVPVPIPERAKPAVPVTDDAIAAVAGFYAGYDKVVRVSVAPQHTLVLEQYSDEGWVVLGQGLAPRADGTWSSDAQPTVAYRTVTAGGRRYLVSQKPAGFGHYLSELPYGQRVEPRADLSPAWRRRVGTVALAVAEHPQSVYLMAGGPLFAVDAVPGLTGYVVAYGSSPQIVDPAGDDARATMMLTIPLEAGRDLDDLVVDARADGEWLRFGSRVYRPRDTVPALARGTSVVPIGPEGWAEWRRLSSGAVVALATAGAWKLYRADFMPLAAGAGNASVALPADGGWLALFGAAGDRPVVTLA
ncbi:MAG: serine hydrolase domain-containing protein [Burkholderiales bacterium]